MRGAGALLLTLTLPAALGAQASGTAAIIWDRYGFDEGVNLGGLGALDAVSELSIPVTVSFPVHERAGLTVSSGYARVTLDGSRGSTSVAGPTDLEARLTLQVLPDRLSVFATTALPTGTESVAPSETPLLAVLVADVLSFSTQRLGGGGSGGIGVAGAFPVGELAFGWAGSFTAYGGFEPLTGSGLEYVPGNEIRLRAGVEGSVAPRTYVRAAGILARRGEDQIADNAAPQVGIRASVYASVEQAVGRGTLTLYAFDAYRARPTLEQTSLGLAALPRGNLIAFGAQGAIPLGGDLRLAPKLELRRSWQAPDAQDGQLEGLGSSVRIGADLSRRINDRMSLVVEGDLVLGSVEAAVFRTEGAADGSTGLRGLRLGTHLSFRP